MALEDFLHPLRSWYRHSPAWFKRSVGEVYAALPMRVRYGGVLGAARRFLDRSQWWSWDEHRAYQWQQMSALVAHCYAHVPYYRRAMQKAHLTPADFRSQEDWSKLPLLTKDQVREYREELVAENMKNRRLASNSGGSTGRPLEFYWERGRTRSLERAFMWRQWAWGGFRYGQRTVVLRGQTVKEGDWHYDPIDRHLFVNAYGLSQENGARIVAKLREFKPVSIQAYPSTLTILALWMREHRAPPIPSIKVLLCGSENLYPAQKELFREVFKARVYSWYGMGESVCLAGYCEQSDLYHAYSEYSYVELIDPDGNVLPWKEGQRGEVVGTCLINDTMPLVRYRTGDIVVVGPPSCPCGRHYRLLARVEGRQQEYVVTSDGRAIALTGMVFGQHWHAFSKIRKLQIAQDEPGKIVMRVVKQPEFGPADEAEIRAKVAGCVGGGLEVLFDYVDDIPPTERGKHLFVKQSLRLPSAWAGEVTPAPLQPATTDPASLS